MCHALSEGDDRDFELLKFPRSVRDLYQEEMAQHGIGRQTGHTYLEASTEACTSSVILGDRLSFAGALISLSVKVT